MPPVGGTVALVVGSQGYRPPTPIKATLLAHFLQIELLPNSNSIKGKIRIHFDRYRISHEGIKVRLVGDLYLKQNRTMIEIFRHCPVETTLEGVDLVHGRNLLKFRLTLPPHKSFPIPFETSDGSLTYRIYAFIKRDGAWNGLAAELLKFKGYYNVMDLGPNSFVETKLLSIKEGEVESTFRVPSTVAIMGQCDGLQAVVQLHGIREKSQVDATLTFFRKTNYGGDTITKVILSQSRHAEIHQNNAEFKLTIGVPMMKQISYSNGEFSVRYYLKYEVILGVGGEQYADAKGVVEVQIGTTRHSHTNEARNQQPTTSTNVMPQTGRRGSVLSLLSMLSLPPAYSQLSSRFGSMMSLETLPPPYDDLKQEE